MHRWEVEPYTYKKNSRQLAATIILLCIIASFAILMQPSDAKQAVIFSDQYEQYVVRPGDTLWGIAKAHSNGQDIRHLVWEIQEVNGITPLIHPGQTLWVPVR